MGTKNKHEKTLARKKILLTDAKGQALKPLNYPDAMELVRSNRRAANFDLGNYYLEQIAEQITNTSEPLVYLLNVYLDALRFNDAERLVAALTERFPVDGPALRARARYHEVAGELQEAEKLLLQAVHIYPKNADNLEQLAALYQSLGDMPRALEFYERALRVDPYYCAALFGKARLVGKKATPEFIAQVRAAIDSRKFSGVQLAFLQFALAFIYADIDADVHFNYLHEANLTSAARRHFDVMAMQKKTENTLYRFRQPVIDALQGLMAEQAKPIFIVGMPRSGTTLLEQIIGAHPQCWPIGEDGAFAGAVEAADKLGCPPLDASSPETRERCRQYFARVAENFKDNRLVLSAKGKNPVSKSLGYHMILGLILLTLPNARVIHLERHPLAVIYSCYQQNFAAGNNFSFKLEWLAEYCKVFKTLMAHWHAVFPGKILTVHYEDLVSDKKAQVERILKFCDLEWSDACMEHEKKVGTILTASDMQVRQPVYRSSIDKWKKVEAHLEPVKIMLGEWAHYPH